MVKSDKNYYHVIYTAIIRSVDEILKLLEGGSVQPSSEKLLKIGELAKATGETTATIRHWTKEGLLHEAKFSKGGYHLYSPEMKLRAEEIRRLQSEERLTLAELKQRFKS